MIVLKIEFVDLCSDQVESESEPRKIDWLMLQNLSMDDYRLLKNGHWLNDTLIDAAQTCL